MIDDHPRKIVAPAQEYEIRIQGHLDESWSDWLEGKELTVADNVTTLQVEIRDQATLRGILSKIWDVNLSLISVNPVQSEPQGTGENGVRQ